VVRCLSRSGNYDSRDATLGDYAWLEEHRHTIDDIAVGIGAPAARLKLWNEIQA